MRRCENSQQRRDLSRDNRPAKQDLKEMSLKRDKRIRSRKQNSNTRWNRGSLKTRKKSRWSRGRKHCSGGGQEEKWSRGKVGSHSQTRSPEKSHQRQTQASKQPRAFYRKRDIAKNNLLKYWTQELAKGLKRKLLKIRSITGETRWERVGWEQSLQEQVRQANDEFPSERFQNSPTVVAGQKSGKNWNVRNKRHRRRKERAARAAQEQKSKAQNTTDLEDEKQAASEDQSSSTPKKNVGTTSGTNQTISKQSRS